MNMKQLLLFAFLAVAAGVAPIPGFRPPAVPLVVQSPYISIWSAHDHLFDGWTTHWSGPVACLYGMFRVDGVPYLFMGSNATAGGDLTLNLPTQNSVIVRSTTTYYSFSAGGVMFNVTFTTPIVTNDWDLLGQPATYVTMSTTPTDGKAHRVQAYFDYTGEVITNSPSSMISWNRYNMTGTNGPATALRIGATNQNPLQCCNDRISWGYAYGMTSNTPADNMKSVLFSSDTTRVWFLTNGSIPAADDPSASRAVDDGWLVAAFTWDFGLVQPSSSASRMLMLAFDEILVMQYFGLNMPPYWRRALPIGSTSVVPIDMLKYAFNMYGPVLSVATAFDDNSLSLQQQVGGDYFATLAQLTYRQVQGAMALAFHPVKNDVWYFLKEISSDGDVSTMDVIFPASPQLLYLSPMLLRQQLVPILEYAMNDTNVPYNLPWCPHHLGTWPVANLPPDKQEQMPIEETGNMMLMIAGIAMRSGGDVTWLSPYWPVIQGYGEYLISALPYPGNQLCTDDFMGPSPNNTNLAIKGIAGIAAYGYILQQWGDSQGAQNAWTVAAQYASTWYDLTFVKTHTKLEYNTDATTWSQKYNMLWLRLLYLDNLVPNQSQLLQAEFNWYQTVVFNQYGMPLDNSANFTKGDWETWLASLAYTKDTPPQPSAFSSQVFESLYNFANATPDRVPLTDWFQTQTPRQQGFQARPVYGAFFAPVLVGTSAGVPEHSRKAIETANAIFRSVHG